MKTNELEINDLMLKVSYGQNSAVELAITQRGAEVVRLNLGAEDAFAIAELLQRHAYLHTSHVEALVDHQTLLASFIAAPALQQ